MARTKTHPSPRLPEPFAAGSRCLKLSRLDTNGDGYLSLEAGANGSTINHASGRFFDKQWADFSTSAGDQARAPTADGDFGP